MDSVKDEPKGCCDSDGDHVYDSDSCERDAGKPESHCGAVGGCCAVSDDDKDDGKAGCGQPDGCCGEPIDDDEVGNAAAVSISAATALTTTTISVVGMTCSDCANSAEKLLRKLPGVVSVDASFAASRVVVHHDALVVGTAEIVERLGKLKFTGTVTSSVVDGASDESAEAEVRRFVVLLSAASRKSDDYAGVVARMRVVRGVEGVDIDSANGRATVHIASNVKRRDVLDAFGAAQLPSALFDAHAAAAAISEASERRELRRWLAQVVLASAIAIPLALMTFAFPDRIAPVVRLSVGFVLCSIVQVVVGAPLYQSAFGALRYTREANVDCLVMLSTTVAYVYSTIVWIVWLAGGAVAGEEAETFFETPPILLALIVIGRYLEKGAKRRTGEALRSIRKLQTPTAQLLSRVEDVDNADAVRTLDCALLDVGDLVRVEPGAAVPVDGVVVRGTTTVDESMITGEARPLRKTVGATMLGGTSNIDGCVALRVTATAHRSTVARIAQLMSDAQTSKPNAQVVADRVAAWFVPIIVVVSFAIFGLWLALIYATTLIDTGGIHGAVYAMRFAIALLVVSCPCAVALSVPPVVVVGAGVAARSGLLVKDGRAFEQLQRITDIFFDKTGTITLGKPRVVALCTPNKKKSKKTANKKAAAAYKVLAVGDGPIDDMSARELLDVCASVEAGSEHPLARGIVLSAKEHLGAGWERRATAEFRAIAGQGVECDVGGERAHVGTPQLLAEQAHCDVGDTAAVESAARSAIGDEAGELSLTIVYASVAGRLLGAIVLADMPRPESAAVVRWLADKRGVNVWLVTGDNASAAQCAARAVGISAANVVAAVSPAGKAEHVRKLQANGAVVCHVGDGVNDAVALTQADIGVAMSSSTDVASSAADVVLLKDGLRDIVVLVDIARAVVLRIRINLSWSFIYNMIAIPIAAGAFQPLSFVLPPALAGLAELLSSLPVIVVAILLYRYSAPHLDSIVSVA